jgi:L-ascorbate 6-phosphate lactonase
MATRADLAERIRSTIPERGLVVWWLGQAGLAIRSAESLVLVDPFLTDYGSFGRTYPPPFEPEDVCPVDAILCTHDHADHIDPEGLPRLLAASPEAAAVVPAAIAAGVGERMGSDRVVGIAVSAPLELAGLKVDAVAAVHALLPEDGYGFHLDDQGRHPFVGYVVECGGVRVGHTGDTLAYEGLPESLRAYDLDALFVPINGISWFRERRTIVGNMNVFEAAELAELAAPKITVPIHWDLFADNTEDPEHFRRYAAAKHPSVHVVVPELAVPIVLE